MLKIYLNKDPAGLALAGAALGFGPDVLAAAFAATQPATASGVRSSLYVTLLAYFSCSRVRRTPASVSLMISSADAPFSAKKFLITRDLRISFVFGLMLYEYYRGLDT